LKICKFASIQQGVLKVREFKMGSSRGEDMSLDEFNRAYNILKNQYYKIRKMKIWEILNENKKNAKYQLSPTRPEGYKKDVDESKIAMKY